MPASKSDISEFLRSIKSVITTGRGLDIIPRPETIGIVKQLGLTKANIRDEILSLSVTNYCEGPIPDRDRPGHIWIFGQKISGLEIYIKLKIVDISSSRIAKLISFHEAQYSMTYPHK